jgi:hypothetical protein
VGSIFLENIFESIVIRVESARNGIFYVGSIYRPGTPNPPLTLTENQNLFLEGLSGLLEYLSVKNAPSYIVGDFNIDVLKIRESTFVQEYIELLFSHGFLQLVTKPTRCAISGSPTVIDHFITNNCENVKLKILTYSVSDHFPVMAQLPSKKRGRDSVIVSYRDFGEENVNKFKQNLSRISFELTLAERDPQLAFNHFYATFSALYEIYFPIKVKSFIQF